MPAATSFLVRSFRAPSTTDIADAVATVWETTLTEEGAESDFTGVIKPIEEAAGVIVAREPT